MINKGFGDNEKKIKVSKFVLNQYEKKALRFLQKGDLKKAEEIYNLFLSENIFSESLINNLSEIYFITNEKNKLINCLKKGTSFYKDSVPLLYKLAKAYRKYNFEKDAIEIYKIILKKSPKI